EVKSKVKILKSITELPVGVGFGIKDAQSAAQVGAVSDGVVIGSAIVNLIHKSTENSSDPEVTRNEIIGFMGNIRTALDALKN
ncbi:MAG: tryptophan synthase subunit alpha, partial [Pseudomonadales bacterium]|nr:tryptophan synthase subunit alpha [Pseudomonadales bacterium]